MIKALQLCSFLLLLTLLVSCQKKTFPTEQKNKKSLAELTANAYDAYILDLPYQRELYRKKGIRLRKMLEVSTGLLPVEEGHLSRVDSFDTSGKLLKTTFLSENYLDSIVYEYQATGQIIATQEYHKEGDTTKTQYVYNKIGMMQQIIYFRTPITAWDLDHNSNGKLTDKRLSDESPTFSPLREIYRYNSVGQMMETLYLTNNMPTSRLKRHYDRKGRITKNEHLTNGIVMSSSSFVYTLDDLLSIQKEMIRLNKNKTQEKVYEFIYENYE